MTVNRIILNDKKGMYAQTFSAKGEKVYAHQPSGEHGPSAIVSPDWEEGGLVMLYGGDIVEFAEVVNGMIEGAADYLNVAKPKTFKLVDLCNSLTALYKEGAINLYTKMQIK